MPTRFYRIVNADELAEITGKGVIRRSADPWPPYEANEVTFVLSDQATLSDLRCFVERLHEEQKPAHLVEIEILGPLPWQIDNDASFEGYQKAIAIRSDIVGSDNVTIRSLGSFPKL